MPHFAMDREITKAILETIGTDFFLKTGARPMTGNFDLAGNDLLTTNYRIQEHAATGTLRLMNRAASAYATFRCKFNPTGDRLLCGDSLHFGNDYTGQTMYMSTYHGNDVFVDMVSFGDDVFNLLRAGDIIHLTGAYHHTLPDTRPASPGTGDLRFDATNKILEVYDGSAWGMANVQHYGFWTGTLAYGRVRYYALNELSSAVTESNNQTACSPYTMREMKINVIANTLDGNAVFTFRLNGGDTSLTVTVGAGVTGIAKFSQNVAIADDDLVCLEVDTSAASSGAINWNPSFKSVS